MIEFDAFALLRQYWSRILPLVMILALVGWALRLDHLRAKHLDDANRLLAAARTAIAAGKTLSAHSKVTADETDAQTVVYRTAYRDRILRLPSANAACARQASVPQSADGSGTSPTDDAVLVPRSDMLICAINTARLQASRDWAIKTQAMMDGPIPEISKDNIPSEIAK